MTKSDMTMQKKENLSPFKIKSLTLCLSSMIPVLMFCRFIIFLKSRLCKNEKSRPRNFRSQLTNTVSIFETGAVRI